MMDEAAATTGQVGPPGPGSASESDEFDESSAMANESTNPADRGHDATGDMNQS
jgi:hypothetical protein